MGDGAGATGAGVTGAGGGASVQACVKARDCKARHGTAYHKAYLGFCQMLPLIEDLVQRAVCARLQHEVVTDVVLHMQNHPDDVRVHEANVIGDLVLQLLLGAAAPFKHHLDSNGMG